LDIEVSNTGEAMGEGLFQPFHILLIVAIILLLFGPAKFAGLGKGIGEGIRNFKSAMKEGEGKKDEVKDEKSAEKKS
jgi:sec-independent protein translocase protein TatA